MTAAANLQAPVPPPSSLHAVVRRLRWRRLRGAVASSLLRAGLALAVPTLVLAWLLPFARTWTLLVVLALLAFAALDAAVRAGLGRRTLLRDIEQALVDPRVLADLDDELRTWLECERARAGSPMLGWLGRDVAARMAALPVRALRPIGRTRAGRLLWLLPIALLLVLVWLVSWWLAPPWNGALGGQQNQPPPSGSGGEQGGGGGGGDRPEAPDQPLPKQPTDDGPEQAPPPPPPESPKPEPPSEQPSPLLQLPEQQRFVLPDFVDDGPTRRARMRAAELENGAAQRPASPSGGEVDAAPSPPPAHEQFERAAEAALRARHVPPAEQPMVRRYFDRLREGKR